MKVHSIVVPTDFSEHSISAGAYALWLADNYQARVRFLHVVQPETGDLDIPVISAQGTINRVEAAREVLQTFSAAVQAKLIQLYKPRHSPDISHEVVVGAPGSEIPAALERRADLCVIGTRGKHNRLDYMFGSITTTVVRKSRIPVFIIPAEIRRLGISSAGYATELSADDPLLIWRTARLIKAFNPILRIVHVHGPEEQDRPTSIDELRAFLSDTLDLSVTYHEIKGADIGKRLLDFAENNELDLLVVHSQRRNFLERMMHPSLGRELVLEGSVPLLMIH